MTGLRSGAREGRRPRSYSRARRLTVELLLSRVVVASYTSHPRLVGGSNSDVGWWLCCKLKATLPVQFTIQFLSWQDIKV